MSSNFHNNLPTSCEIELTTKCNALCPQCVRSYYGAKKWHTVPNKNIDPAIIIQMLDNDVCSNINFIRLVGTYGDPIVHPKMLDIVADIKKRKIKLLISTNGGIRNEKWWKNLASLLDENDKVLFCIDGLEDTNHIYRKGVVWTNVIKNIKAFNSAGGKSIWTFIVFKHNEHQVHEAEKISKQLGCYSFAYKPTSRFVDKQHKLIARFPVLDATDSIIHYLEPPDQEKYRSKSIDSYRQTVIKHNSRLNYLSTVDISCDAINKNYFNVSAEAYVFPCAWLYDRLYGYEAEQHTDHTRMLSMIDASGGMEKINLQSTSIDNILQSNFFNAVKQSWSCGNKLERCANQCGVESNVLTSYEQIEQLL